MVKKERFEQRGESKELHWMLQARCLPFSLLQNWAWLLTSWIFCNQFTRSVFFLVRGASLLTVSLLSVFLHSTLSLCTTWSTTLFSAPSFSARFVPTSCEFLPETQNSVLSLFSPEENEEEARGRKEQKKQQRRRAKTQAANTEKARKQRQNQKQVHSMWLAVPSRSTTPKGSLKNQHFKGVRNLRLFPGRES